MQNGHVESYNGELRDECLDQNWFLDLAEAREITEDYRRDYNEERPHSALGNQTPNEFARRSAGGWGFLVWNPRGG